MSLFVRVLLIFFLSIVLINAWLASNENSDLKNNDARPIVRQTPKYPEVPDLIPPLHTKTIDPTASKKAKSVRDNNFCRELGRAIRGKDKEFARAMIMRAHNEFATTLNFATEDNIKKKLIQIGMPACAVSASFGYPERINRSVYSFGVHEQWVYNGGGMYVYFEDNILTSWQE